MKNLIFASIISIQLFAQDISLLHTQKQEIQKQKLEEIEASHKSQKNKWISPLNLSLSANKSKAALGAINYTSERAAIGLNQDIFRFGGIRYSISAADLQKNYNLLGWDKQNAALYEKLYTILLTLKKLQFQLDQGNYRLKNREIEVFIKKEQYKTGATDMTVLNDALMNTNEELKRVKALKELISNQQKELKKLTSLSFNDIKVPFFSRISRGTYIAENYDINQAGLKSQVAHEQLKITKSDYLPHISLNGDLGYQNYDYEISSNSYEGSYYNVGLSVTMPLDFNRKSNIEEKKAAYLRQRSEIADKKIEADAKYEQIQSSVNNYEEYITITQNNLKLYKELIDMTKKGFESGYRTGYDLQTIQNTYKIDVLEVQINKVNIQLELVKLHFAMQQEGKS